VFEGEELVAAVTLQSIPGLGPATLTKWLERFESPTQALFGSKPADVIDLVPEAARELPAARDRVEGVGRLVASLRRDGVRVLTPDDVGYPILLSRLKTMPPLLYLRGEWQECDEQSVAVIGSTHPSSHGWEIARQCAARLVQLGRTVVSGYARGIDAAAHLAALEAGGRTIFVLPTGLARFHPHEGFTDRDLRREGAVVLSEAFPEQEWSTETALARNRLTAALSQTVLIIEARPESGTLHTFGLAQRMGIPTFAVRRKQRIDGNEIAIDHGAAPVCCRAELEFVAQAKPAPLKHVRQETFEW